MWKFLSRVFAVFIALVLFTVFAIFVLLGLGTAASNSQKGASTPDNSVLVLDLNKPINELEIDNPLAELDLPILNQKNNIGLLELKSTIEQATKDEKIKGIYLKLSLMQCGLASIEEIRNALISFKKSGKFIFTYAENLSEGAYYLASVSDKIFITPGGLLEFNGLSADYLFFKGTLDKLEIKPEVFKVGNYKSAVEPFLLDKMSDYSKEQSLSFLTSMHTHLLQRVAESRKIDFKTLKLISDSMLVHNSKDAVRLGIVTDEGYFDQFVTALQKKLNLKETEKVSLLSYAKYRSNLEEIAEKYEDKIAIIVAEGEINSGKSDDESIGSDDMAEIIRKARKDSSIKAIVLRVNSPGGSALASDIMWREVVLTTQVKPVIASMSDVAASGGYFLAMGCNKIVAQPNAITGSIGVFGLFLNLKNFLDHKLGITSDGVKTGLFSDLGKRQRDLTAHERKVIQQEVDEIYQDFVSKSAKSRKMSFDSLNRLASGRVWSGIEAYQNGLIDALGGIDKAIAMAAKQAKLEKGFDIVYLPKQKPFFEQFFNDLQAQMQEKSLKNELGEAYLYVKNLKMLQKKQGIQAKLNLIMENW
jgi:protease IV